MSSNNEGIVLFDGVCNLCNGLVKFIIKNDKPGRIKFAALQSLFSKNLMTGIGLNPQNFNSVVYISGTSYYTKSAAILTMFRDMGGGWKIMFVFKIIPRFIRDYIYDLVGRNRYRLFGKRDSCMIPTPEIRSRFLG